MISCGLRGELDAVAFATNRQRRRVVCRKWDSVRDRNRRCGFIEECPCRKCDIESRERGKGWPRYDGGGGRTKLCPRASRGRAQSSSTLPAPSRWVSRTLLNGSKPKIPRLAVRVAQGFFSAPRNRRALHTENQPTQPRLYSGGGGLFWEARARLLLEQVEGGERGRASAKVGEVEDGVDEGLEV